MTASTPDRIHACTIVTVGFLPFARVFAQSFLEHHPDLRVTVLVVDDRDGTFHLAAEPFEVLHLRDIGVSLQEECRMAAIYDATEMACAFKPWLMRHLLDSGAEPVLYFDADIWVFGPLDDLADLARRHGVVITPHTTEPIPRDGWRPTEREILQVGAYNAGFVGMGAAGRRMTQWWSDRLRRDGIREVADMLFTDQRWLDFVPGYFPHVVLRDPTVNVAYWNIYGRELGQNADSITVNGERLRFFHFSGFDPSHPELLSAYSSIQPPPGSVLGRLCSDYARRLIIAGYGCEPSEYRYERLSNGIKLDRPMRRAYRAALIDAEVKGTPEPPNPFVTRGDDAFIEWLNTPPDGSVMVSRYWHQAYRFRPDLQAHFPDLTRRDVRRFIGWVTEFGWREFGAPAELMPTPAFIEVADVMEAEIRAETATDAKAARAKQGRADARMAKQQRGRIGRFARRLTDRLITMVRT
jgi:hypothetical protein